MRDLFSNTSTEMEHLEDLILDHIAYNVTCPTDNNVNYSKLAHFKIQLYFKIISAVSYRRRRRRRPSGFVAGHQLRGHEHAVVTADQQHHGQDQEGAVVVQRRNWPQRSHQPFGRRCGPGAGRCGGRRSPELALLRPGYRRRRLDGKK
jgi:hypothetical protein